MKAKYDLTNAGALVEEYIREIQRPDIPPARTGSRSWIELAMARHGIVPSYKDQFGWGDSHAIWYACLIVTGNVRRVSRLEKQMRMCRQTTTETTIRRMLGRKGILANAVSTRYLHEILEAVGNKPIHPALALFERLFDEAAATASPVSPSSFVEMSAFQAKLAHAGIDRPENFVEFAQWWDDRRGPEFAHRLIMAHHRKHGTEPSAYEKAAWKAHLMHRRMAAA